MIGAFSALYPEYDLMRPFRRVLPLQLKAKRYPEAITALSQWMAQGKIKVRTQVVDGLENALHTLKKLYTGANTGKLMIRVKDVAGT